MQKLVLFVIVFGAAVGLAAPRGETEAPQGAAQTSSQGGPTRLAREDDGHFYAEALVNGEPVRFLVDTGATSVALTMADAERIGIEVTPEQFEVVGSGASGPVRGQTVLLDNVEVDGRNAVDVRGAVLEGLEVSLLGQAYLQQLDKVEISGDEMVLR